MNLRTSVGSFTPGADSTPVATSTPHGRTRSTASATLSGVRPPASRIRSPDGAPSASDQSKTWPEPGLSESIITMSAPNPAARARSGSPPGNALMTTGTRARTQRVSSADSWPCSCAARRPAWLVISTTRSRASLRKMPTVRISGGSRLAMSAARDAARKRGDDGTKLKPTASAPMATARRASSSDVMPQTLTNTRWRLSTRDPEIGDRSGGIASRHHRLADEHGVEAGLHEPLRVVPPPDAGLGHPHHALGHGGADAHGPLGVDLEGHEVPLVDPDEVS